MLPFRQESLRAFGLSRHHAVRIQVKNIIDVAPLAMQSRTEPYLCSSHLAMPAMADLLRVLSAVAAYLLAFSVVSLWHGAISDAFGRCCDIFASRARFALTGRSWLITQLIAKFAPLIAVSRQGESGHS